MDDRIRAESLPFPNKLATDITGSSMITFITEPTVVRPGVKISTAVRIPLDDYLELCADRTSLREHLCRKVAGNMYGLSEVSFDLAAVTPAGSFVPRYAYVSITGIGC